jgi:CubicO group peptidase (beta-lactamase class C family)
VLAAAAASSARAQGSVETRIAELFAPWNEPGSPGAAVAVARDGETIYAGAFGLANLTYGLPITAQTRFNAGSIAKHVTAVAVLMLAAEGRLSLDDEIHRYLPELPDYGAPIAIRDLLQQTSGLRDYRSLMLLAGWRSGDVQTNEQALDLIFRQNALNFPTRTGFTYSNSNFVLAAEIVARISGQSFGTWAHANMFVPLGMASTEIHEDHAEIVPGLASSYAYRGEGKGFAEDLLDTSVVGSGNLITTPDDLLVWAEHLRATKLDGVPLIERLAEQAVLAGGARSGYGLGVFVGTHRGLPIVHHGGETAGNRAYLMIFPQQRVAIVILANVGSLRPEAAARGIADVVLEEQFAVPPETPAAAEPALPLEAYLGLYELETGPLVDVGTAEGVPYVIFGGTPPRPFLSLGGHAFGTGEAGVVFRFSPDESGAINGLVLDLPGSTVGGRRVPPLRLGPEELAQYVGTYFSAELETFYRIEAADGGLIARQMRLNDTRLRPIGNGRFLEEPGANLRVEFRTGRRGRIEGFALSLSRARDIAFTRQ